MRVPILTLLFVIIAFSIVFAQEIDDIDFYKKSNQINITGMWAVQRNHRLDFLKNADLSFIQYENLSQLTVVIHF